MSRIAAIDVALRLQLEAEGKRPPNYSVRLSEAPFSYDESSIQLFLLNVANRLKLDTPALSFDWRGIDPARTIRSSLSVLIGQIETAISLEKQP